MSEKILKGRLVQKHDVEANWELATNFIPKQGEVIVYDIDENYNYERIKIGDGTTNVNDLPFIDDAMPHTIKEVEIINIARDEFVAKIGTTSFNKDLSSTGVVFDPNKRYVFEFMGERKLGNISEQNYVLATFGDISIQITDWWGLYLTIYGTITESFTDLKIYELEIVELDNACLEKDVVIQNSISISRKGEVGGFSSALGFYTEASGEAAHAEGNQTKATGSNAHAEGRLTTASGGDSHVEGYNNIASGDRSHVEGSGNIASGEQAHAEGLSTLASSANQHVQGKYNIEDAANTYAHIVGNGTSDSKRSNAHTIDWNGTAWFAGDVTVGVDAKKLATEEQINKFGGTVEVTSGTPIKENTVLTLNPDGEEINLYTAEEIDSMMSELSGGITSIPSEYITESELDAKGYLTSIPSEYVTESELTSKGYLTAVPSEYVTDSELNAKGYLTQHQDLSAYAKTSAIPTKVSQLTNDKNYLTAVPSEYVTETELVAKNYLTVVPSEYVTETELAAKGYATQIAVNELSEEIDDLNAQLLYGGEPLFENLADPTSANDSAPNTSADTWLNGYYILSKEVTANSAVSRIVTTNFIPCTYEDTIRITGFVTEGQNSGGTLYRSYFRVIPYDTSGTALLSEVYPAIDRATQGTGRLDYMDAEELENGVYCFIPKNDYAASYWKNVAYIRICGVAENNEDVIVTVNETIEYSVTFEDRVTSLEKAVAELNDKDTETESGSGSESGGNTATTTTDSVEILLPSEVIAVVGVEFNIYYKSIIRANKSLDNFEIKCSMSDTSIGYKLLKECFRLTATSSNVGDYTLTVQVKDITSGSVKATKTVNMHIIENRTLNTKNVLYIGDSLTASRGGLYAAEIQYNLSGGKLVSIGTQNGSADTNSVGAVKHEGYNGATVAGFLASTVTSGNTNKFYNPTTGEFDLSYFMTNQGYTQLDATMLNLGHNNIGNHVNAVNGLKTIISKIHEYDANIPVIVSLIEPLGNQDAWSVKTKSTMEEMNRHWKNLLSAYITAFDNNAISNVYLSTPYLNIDADNDFPTETVARCSRDTTQIVRQNDPMHPNRVGNLKMADAYFASLMYHIPEDDAIYHTVTKNLTNVTINNSAGSVKEGTSYTATLTPAEGYVLKSVTVTMGGSPVAVTNGAINISAVTGDIIITATAELYVPSYTNLAKPSTATSSPNTALTADEWLNDYYISSKKISAKSNLFVTNKIPLTKTDTIRIKGIETTGTIDGSTCASRFRVLPCDANGNALLTEIQPAMSYSSVGAGRLECMDATELENGVYCFSPQNDRSSSGSTATYWNDVAYVRICGRAIDGNVNNVIVTVNEPIE